MGIVLRLRAEKLRPALRGIELFWSQMMEFGRRDAEFAIADLAIAKTDHVALRLYLKQLMAAGIVSRRSEVAYRIVKPQSSPPRFRRSGELIDSVLRRQALWNAMRSPSCRLGFSVRDLVQLASTDEEPVSYGVAEAYVTALDAAGFLLTLPAREKPPRWRLDPKMNSGPNAPRLMRAAIVFDPNKSEVVGAVQAEELHQ